MKRDRLIIFTVAAVLIGLLVILTSVLTDQKTEIPQSVSSTPMLSDPFLQLPTENSVRVVWFTKFAGSEHSVAFGEKLNQKVEATTTKLSRLREDQKSVVQNQTEEELYKQPTMRDIWRHEAIVSGLTPRQRIPYQVMSVRNRQGEVEIRSEVFTLAPKPQPGTRLQILLTSDHQLKPMTAANLQKVVETVGRPDAVFMAGDLVNVPDRASEWFDDGRGGAFFPGLQGRAQYKLDGTEVAYQGGEIIQHAPLFPAIGNHEVMGRFSMEQGLDSQFADAFPRQEALAYYKEIAEQINPGADPQLREAWLKTNSFNTDTYEEIFTLPQSGSGGEKYYAVTFGDIRLVALFVTNIWRSPKLSPKVQGRYQEREQDRDRPQNWGYGQHIFEPIAKGSPQYQWLEQELNSEAFKQAKYKIVMFHHPPHSLGDNVVPPYTDPIPKIEYTADGSVELARARRPKQFGRNVESVRYDYPQENDFIIRDLVPLLEEAGVQLVFYGHSHLWNRFVSPTGMHFLETSNVGNTYGAFLGDKQRPVPTDASGPIYAAVGDPNGLEAVVPTIAPLVDEAGQPLPYIASNEITVFSILDTEDGTISSYRFDTRQPEVPPVKFDQFAIAENK